MRHHVRRLLLPLLPLIVLLAAAPRLQAQWQSTTYTLKGGWNTIYLHGSGTHATLDQHFPNSGDAANVQEVWRWNPNPTQVQFTSSPLIPSEGTPEWSIWRRGAPAQSTLTQLTGQTAYLVKCAGASTTTYGVPLVTRTQPPSSTWVRSGANLLGFPTFKNGSNFPFFTSYFATFPAAVAANTKIYRYDGGDLGPANPVQVFFPSTERLDRNQAYWFEADVVGSFYAPIELAPSNLAGLEFGSTGSVIAVRVRNRTAAPVTLTITPVVSAAAPEGQDGITGPAPVTRRTFNTTSGQWEETAIGGAYTEVIGPQSSRELEFGINRAAMPGAANALYASFLRFTDSGSLMEVYMPVSARVSSFAGLWVGDVTVNTVQSKVAGSPGQTTARSFPLRYILHVDDAGTVRMLSQAFVGTLEAAPHNWGVCTTEAGLKEDQKASAMRLVAAHMPLDRVLTTGAGGMTLGGTLTRTINLPYQDNVNPFVHKYHPDHDNKDARFQAVGNKVESHTVDRAVSFAFLASAPPGTSGAGWGSTVMGGNYTEVITGIHRQTITVGGTFTFRRLNEIGAITTN